MPILHNQPYYELLYSVLLCSCWGRCLILYSLHMMIHGIWYLGHVVSVCILGVCPYLYLLYLFNAYSYLQSVQSITLLVHS